MGNRPRSLQINLAPSCNVCQIKNCRPITESFSHDKNRLMMKFNGYAIEQTKSGLNSI